MAMALFSWIRKWKRSRARHEIQNLRLNSAALCAAGGKRYIMLCKSVSSSFGTEISQRRNWWRLWSAVNHSSTISFVPVPLLRSIYPHVAYLMTNSSKIPAQFRPILSAAGFSIVDNVKSPWHRIRLAIEAINRITPEKQLNAELGRANSRVKLSCVPPRPALCLTILRFWRGLIYHRKMCVFVFLRPLCDSSDFKVLFFGRKEKIRRKKMKIRSALVVHVVTWLFEFGIFRGSSFMVLGN